jgi:rare lipoprotein A
LNLHSYNKKQQYICLIISVAFLLLWINGCGPAHAPQTVPGQPAPYKVGGTWYQPMSDADGYKERGIASWYGKKFHGRKTSSGEVYDMYAMTAAHKTLPLGTYVRVRNLDNGKVIDVRINDRGPFVAGRIIDLSYTGANKLDIVGPGTAPVEVTALGVAVGVSNGRQTYMKVDYETGPFTVQVGAFLEQSNAIRLKSKLGGSYKNAHIVSYFDGQKTFYRVRVGRLATLTEAQEYEQMLKISGFPTATIVAE